MKKNLLRYTLMLTLACVLGMLCASAQGATVDITGTPQGVDTRILIAVPPLSSTDASLMAIGAEMADVISYDLSFSGLFKILPPASYPQGFSRFSPDLALMNLDAWKTTKAEHIVFGTVNVEGSNLVCRMRVFDMNSGKQVVGQELRVDRNHPRLNPHRFSEEIIRFLDGTPGIGTTEIVFSGGETGRKEIYSADYDGANIRRLTNHSNISIKPKLSPDGSKIAYLSYKDRYPFLYIYNRQTGVSAPLSKEVGLNSAPAWSPNSAKLALTLSKDGNTEIYLKNPDGSGSARLTKNTYGDTQPSFSPDGKRIAFVSERGGSPQVWVMNTDGSGASRLSMQGGNTYDPIWSPDGKSIAYVVEKKGSGLQIWVMNADGTEARPITDSGNNESPCWSPDSRHLAYMVSGQLWCATLSTGDRHRIARINMRAEGPSWGPRRK